MVAGISILGAQPRLALAQQPRAAFAESHGGGNHRWDWIDGGMALGRYGGLDWGCFRLAERI